jgi:hypothetical protein
MRKINLLAFATAMLAIASIVTNLVRMDTAANGKVPTSPAAPVQTAAAPEAPSFDAI